ncbi:RteC domain-containing protein [Mucilaginibacter lacusdianchii]|uniref:RteC domain-containing protein n=1 Tax=Mucilaginibacter lacusdianchii TaxID=2684211 RepID=UPI00131C9F0C|nr:RteC domain-containing protein [Mucilaginibacter sp. JXJ CY 39]
METPLEQSLRRLEDELEALDRLAPQERYPQALARIDAELHRFRQWIEEHPFQSQDEEIAFFKNLRPRILAFRIEEAMRYNLMMNQPIGTTKVVSRYLEEILEGLQSFFRLHSFYYQYYKNGFQELDHLYFVQAEPATRLPVPEVTDQAGPLLPPMSSLFARFMAYERLQVHITRRLGAMQAGRELPVEQTDADRLRWTGEILAIVEVIYGLWLTGQLNHGNASLNHIVRWFEVHLEVSIGVPQRQFAKIERRKRYSSTKFLDHMKNAIQQKLDEDHGA